MVDISSSVPMSRASAPPTRTAPEPVSQKRVMSRVTVVFPEPDGPTRAVMECSGMLKETSRSTGVPASAA